MAKIEVPVDPPSDWFQPPADIPTDKRITIEPDGRVFGYIALWDTCHVGHGECVRPPKGSPSQYDYAHQGETLTADGSLVKTAVIAGGTKHAPVDLNTALVPEYYEDTGTQLMRVRYGEDDQGLWFAGALWPDVDDLQVAQIRASSISGDWRFHAAWRQTATDYDFAGACLVNIPGFPMASAGGKSNQVGRPFALAAAALHLEGEYMVFENEQLIGDTVAKDNDEPCNGDCTDCGCGKLNEEQQDELLAAAYQILAKRKKKKPDTISADGAPDEDDDTPDAAQLLAERLDGIQNAVDWLVADKLTADLSTDVE